LQIHTHTRKHGNAKWEEGGRADCSGRKCSPRDTQEQKHQTPRGLSSSPPPPLHAHSSTATRTRRHTQPPALHMLCTGGEGRGEGTRTHRQPPHTLPTSVSLKNPRQVQRFIYRGGEDRGQAPAGTGGMVKRVQGVCVGCERRGALHTHLISHDINQTPAGDHRCHPPAPPAPGQARLPGWWGN
jgi:hypothetical protein